MQRLHVDIETYSSVSIQSSGLYKYAQAADFTVLLFAYAADDGPVQIVDLASGGELPLDMLVALGDPRVLKYAYNAAFEWYCLSRHFGIADPVTWLPQWRCTMLHGLYLGYPGGLAAVGAALGLPAAVRKQSTGSALIRTFCIPCKPTRANGGRTRTLPRHEPERWRLFKEYCVQDVVTEREVEQRLSVIPVPDMEQTLWQLDQSVNLRGVPIDRELVDGALYCGAETADALMREAVALTGLDNPKSAVQLKTWLSEELDEDAPDNLQRQTVESLLAQGLDNDKATRVLELRLQMSKTSTRKYDAMRACMCEDTRVRGLSQHYGANRTGRYAGRLIQAQNLPRNYLDTLDLARDLTRRAQLSSLRYIYGNVPDTLSQLVRTAFVPAPGNVFAVADYSAIEARVIAWLAGEQWRLDVFKTHGKIYEASASAMFGVPLEEITKDSPLRQKGKVAELALGYQGGPGALVRMGALTMGLAEDELPDIVRRWRAASARIVDLWYALERAAIETVRTGVPTGTHGLLLTRTGAYESALDWLTIQLPSGRSLYYAKPSLAANRYGNESIHFWGVNQQSKKWAPDETYGGKLAENVVQAIARDCLALAMLRLDAAGYRIVMHVHDEVVIEVPEAAADIDRISAIMCEPMPWAQGLPLTADGFITPYYRK